MVRARLEGATYRQPKRFPSRLKDWSEKTLLDNLNSVLDSRDVGTWKWIYPQWKKAYKNWVKLFDDARKKLNLSYKDFILEIASEPGVSMKHGSWEEILLAYKLAKEFNPKLVTELCAASITKIEDLMPYLPYTDTFVLWDGLTERTGYNEFIALTLWDYSDMMSLNRKTREEKNERTPQSGYPHIREA